MSIVVETFIICDSRASPNCRENFGVDNRHLTGSQQRKEMLQNSWKRVGGMDVCPECLYEIEQQKTKSK